MYCARHTSSSSAHPLFRAIRRRPDQAPSRKIDPLRRVHSPHQDLSVQNEDAVGVEPCIRYDPICTMAYRVFQQLVKHLLTDIKSSKPRYSFSISAFARQNTP